MASSTETLPSLIVITDWDLGRTRLLSILERVVALGPRIAVQHRHPGAATFDEEAELLATLCKRSDNPLIINGRPDLAHALDTHLHLANPNGASAPPGKWLSCAVHNEHELSRATHATFALVSPVYPPLSKPSDARPPLGVEGFRRLAATLPCPAYALGGVTPISAPGLRNAVIHSVLGADDPVAQAKAFLGLRQVI
ncbi:MAG: thiamine phosphate synthase [Myxococcaceae bacterium]